MTNNNEFERRDNEQVLELFRNCAERRQQIALDLIEMFKGETP